MGPGSNDAHLVMRRLGDVDDDGAEEMAHVRSIVEPHGCMAWWTTYYCTADERTRICVEVSA